MKEPSRCRDYKLISICHAKAILLNTGLWCGCNGIRKRCICDSSIREWYTNENIDQMLMERHLNKKARRASGKNHLKGPRKRTAEDVMTFLERLLEEMIYMAMTRRI